MKERIKTHTLGKLRIYLTNGETVKSQRLLRKLFPKNTYRQLITEAKNEGIMNASVFPTHFGYSNNGKIEQHSLESHNPGLTMCVELIDNRERLEIFFSKHMDILKGKVVIYKQVEFWDIE